MCVRVCTYVRMYEAVGPFGGCFTCSNLGSREAKGRIATTKNNKGATTFYSGWQIVCAVDRSGIRSMVVSR